MTQLSRLLGAAALGMLVALWLSQPAGRIVGAVVHQTTCGIMGIVEIRDNGDIELHTEYPGEEFIDAVNGLPEDQVIIANMPCPYEQLLRPQYEAQQNQENPAQVHAEKAPREGVHRPGGAA